MNYYIGLSLASGSNMDSGVAVIDEENNIILIDKLYKMNDVKFFFENFSSQSFVGFEKLAEIIIEIPFAFPALFLNCSSVFRRF